ncbi:accessory gland protein Acp29AB-like, partial [Drosophila subpulchrella]|uniref:accessory gland protein Acp29AB-like n=1 Tax=Drosophila subpulchrella TaxID=1486046 RepID=UPI0018A19F09
RWRRARLFAFLTTSRIASSHGYGYFYGYEHQTRRKISGVYKKKTFLDSFQKYLGFSFVLLECEEATDQDRCSHLVKPLLDLVAAGQERLKTCEANQINGTFARLDRIEGQLETLKKVIPPNFEKIGSRYFYFERRVKQNWFAAANICRQLGGALASIQSDEELTAIKHHPKRDYEEHYWLDINDLAAENTFVSSTSGHNAPFLKWASTEPNNLNKLEHCVDLYWEHMYDNYCTKMYYFICQSEK